MCGRFVRKSDLRKVAEHFTVDVLEALLPPSYNVAPRQPTAVIMEDGKRKIVSMQWGLVPSWSKDPKIGYKMINARAETIHEKPSYKNAFIHRRCLIIADGFYEWITQGKTKTPLYIYLENQEPFAMAGIYELWKSETGEVHKTCSIITTEANAFMKQIHHRMPVILDKKDHDAWLAPDYDEQRLRSLLKPYTGLMKCHEVTTLVNSPSHDSEECIRPMG